MTTGIPIMWQRWKKLLFLHWPVPAAAIHPLLPPGLELDLYQGEAYVTLIPFTMSGIRPIGLPPLPLLSQSHETNLRTYVRRNGRDPGIWFFSLDAANPFAVAAARLLFGLPYFWARMSLKVGRNDPAAQPGESRHVRYRTRRLCPEPLPASCEVEYTPHGMPAPTVPGTLDQFLIERYLLYAARSGRLLRGQLEHKPYPLQQAAVQPLREDLLAAPGGRGLRFTGSRELKGFLEPRR